LLDGRFAERPVRQGNVSLFRYSSSDSSTCPCYGAMGELASAFGIFGDTMGRPSKHGSCE
jgi:hypothetical protein